MNPSKKGGVKVKPTVVIKLTKEQRKNLEAILWLLGGPRGSGRTYLLALGFIITAINNPNVTYYVFDHFSPEVRSRAQMLETIASIITIEDIKGFTLSKSNLSIKFSSHSNLLKNK